MTDQAKRSDCTPFEVALTRTFMARFAIVIPLSIMAYAQAVAAESAKEQVWAAETAFAHTMATRDLAAFAQFLSDEAVFFGDTSVLRGKEQVIAAWSKLFSGSEAPFSWAPDQVEVLQSGTLALSTGPVRDAAGTVVARFNTIWRLESANRWRVVFDKGQPPTPGPQHPTAGSASGDLPP